MVGFVPATIGNEKILHCTVGVPLEPSAALQKKEKLRGKMLSVTAAHNVAGEGD